LTSIGWLHFTDLHRGMAEQDHLWPTLRHELFEDLSRLAEVSGPWDLVLFTGDLTQTGRSEEFDRLTDPLGRLLEHLAHFGSRPLFLAVPGNHDLIRPRVSAVVRALRRFHDERDLQAEFWRDPESEYRALIDEAFAPFMAWNKTFTSLENTGSGPSLSLNPGLLPGDFSATITKEGLRLGIVGLNSSFLQLTGDNYEGRLHLDPRQLHAACKGDGPEWLHRHHLNLLLTHHPPEWLHVGSLAQFRAEIAPPGWFEAHLFGHMHEPLAELRQIGGFRAERRLQGASLFGLESFGDGTHQRVHGYSAGRVSVDGKQGSLALWPRIAILAKAGHRKIVPDQGFDLDKTGAFTSDIAVRAVVPSKPPPAATPARTPAAPLQDPGGPYDARWYVSREEAEQKAIVLLRQPGQPVAIWGPELFGKRWILRHLTDQLVNLEPTMRVAAVNLRLMGGDAMGSLNAFLEEFAAQVLEALGLDETALAAAWNRPGTPAKKLTRLLSTTVLPSAPGPLLVAIDQADALWKRAWCDDFFDLLRGFTDRAEAEPWSRLRILVTMSTTPVLLTKEINRSPFANVASRVSLGDFTAAQVQKLAEMHGLSWSDDEIERLMNLVGGHPFLVRLVMVKAARDGAPLDTLLDESHPLFSAFLDRGRFRLSKNPGLFEALLAAVERPDRPIDPEALLRLERAGVLCESEGRYRLRYRLYERLLDFGVKTRR